MIAENTRVRRVSNLPCTQRVRQRRVVICRKGIIADRGFFLAPHSAFLNGSIFFVTPSLSPSK